MQAIHTDGSTVATMPYASPMHRSPRGVHSLPTAIRAERVERRRGLPHA